MAATNYQRSIEGDFPNQQVSPSCLKRQIEMSDIVTALQCIHTQEDDCNIWFEDALSGGDETLLDGIIAAHEGSCTSDATQTETSGGESTTDSIDFETKLALTSGRLTEGTYLISWNFEVRVSDEGLGCGVRTQVLCDDVERSEDNWAREYWHHNNGSAVVDFEQGDAPVVKINFKVLGVGGDVVRIRRARVSIMRAV